MSKQASNAVLAKVRAMYSKRLTKQNYQELLNCRDVTELAAYLCQGTAYACAFEKSSTAAYHRRQLESILYSALYLRLSVVCRYLTAAGNGFYEYLVLQTDMEQLIHAVRNLNSSHPGDFAVKLPPYFKKYSYIKNPLDGVTDFEGLLQALEGSPYYDWFKVFQRGTEPDFFDIELMLNRRYRSLRRELAKKHCIGEERQQLLELFGYDTDIENLVCVYRLKRFGNAELSLIKDVTHENPESLLSRKAWEEIEAADSEKTVLELISKTDFSPLCRQSFIEMAGEKLLYKKAKKLLRFSSEPCVVLVCYVVLLKTEVHNLIHIIEGIRYKLSPDEISEFLIGAGD